MIENRVNGGLVAAAGIGVRFAERWLFRGIDLHVDPGECVAITGSNGSGKSTLLRCLHGDEELTEGTVAVAGVAPDERSAAFRREVSVLLDDSDTFEELTPRQHVDLLAGTFGSTLAPEQLLRDAGLAERADVAAGLLSAGEQRRLLLVGATARPHRVLLVDEPERALDATGRRWLVDLLGAAKSSAAVVLATHHAPLVDAVADRVVAL